MRLEAKRRRLDTTGTLGVLLDAGDQGLIAPEPAYRRLLRETTSRSSPALEAQFIEQVVRRPKKQP